MKFPPPTRTGITNIVSGVVGVVVVIVANAVNVIDVVHVNDFLFRAPAIELERKLKRRAADYPMFEFEQKDISFEIISNYLL